VYLSIIAVHGLGGRALDTWSHENGTNLLRDLLPTKIPNAEFYTFGYNARRVNHNAVLTIDDVARQLIADLESLRDSVLKEPQPVSIPKYRK
jgi:hypothetical protein